MLKVQTEDEVKKIGTTVTSAFCDIRIPEMF